MPKIMAIFSVLVFLFAACGGDESDSQPSRGSGNEDDMDMGGDDMDMGGDDFAFGEPGDQSDADRKIDVSALDSLEFDPESVTAQAGETITFVVTNDGGDVHEFVIGDESYQQEHEAEMAEDDGMEMESNQIEIESGETKSLTWTFTEPGEVLYACHEPSHYEGGMVGTIEVST
jgi:uncharacterized cupredoxin-like copper-binding protein